MESGECVDKMSGEISDIPSTSENSLDQNERRCLASREVSLEESDHFTDDRSTEPDQSGCDSDPPPNDVNKSDHNTVEEPKLVASSPPAVTPEATKGVNFTNIFGATKKVIFRTTQVIIENHERKAALKAKNAAEAEKKSPKHSEISPLGGSPGPASSPVGSATTPNGDSESTVTTSVSSIARAGSHNGLLRFLESPIFNVHFALHYLFYSKEPGVLSFIGNKIFSFKDQDVDLYIPQLILMYIQMSELAEVLDPYLVYRCRKAVDFCLKCLWLLEAYNYNADSFVQNSCDKKTHLRLMRQIYPKNEKKRLGNSDISKEGDTLPLTVKTHHRYVKN